MKNKRRILITGSRELTYSPRMRKSAHVRAIEDICSRYIDVDDIVVHGAARGADSVVDQWCRRNGIETEPHPVTKEDWKKSKFAGPLRNKRMADSGGEFLLAFPAKGIDSRGTYGMVRECKKRGIEVFIFEISPPSDN